MTKRQPPERPEPNVDFTDTGVDISFNCLMIILFLVAMALIFTFIAAIWTFLATVWWTISL